MAKDSKQPLTPLARIRKDRDISQAELGARVGLTQAQIQRMESGKRPILPRRAKQLAEVLECHWLDLMDESSLEKMEAEQLFSPKETALVELYRGLSEGDQQAVFRIADAMAEHGKKNVKR